MEEGAKEKTLDIASSSGGSDTEDADTYITARQRKKEQVNKFILIISKQNILKEHRRLLLKNLLHSTAMTEAQADKNLKEETEELLAAKRRKKEEEKKIEEAKKSLLEKHNEILQQEQGLLFGLV